MDPLRSAMDHLYDAFAHYPLRARIEGCPHCDLGTAERGVHSAPLRELTSKDLGVYPFKAMSTFGDRDDFRHFLPRIVELVTIEGRAGTCDLPMLVAKLRYGSARTWPDEERAALCGWLNALERGYREGGSGIHARDLVAADLALGRDADGFLSRWLTASAQLPMEDLADAVLDVAAATQQLGGDPTDEVISRFVLSHRRQVEGALRSALERFGLHASMVQAAEALARLPFV